MAGLTGLAFADMQRLQMNLEGERAADEAAADAEAAKFIGANDGGVKGKVRVMAPRLRPPPPPPLPLLLPCSSLASS